jgi:hypothetical protein
MLGNALDTTRSDQMSRLFFEDMFSDLEPERSASITNVSYSNEFAKIVNITTPYLMLRIYQERLQPSISSYRHSHFLFSPLNVNL